MPVFDKIGFRNAGLNLIDYINWIRLYGWKDGRSLYKTTSRLNKNVYKASASFLKVPFVLRNNNSDKRIFKQTFYDKQYEIYNKPFSNVKYIIDAGANMGTASVYFSIMFPDAEIIAIEPEKDNFRMLSNNIKSYTNITALNAALWFKSDMLQIINPDSEAAGFVVDTSDEGIVKAFTMHEIFKMINAEIVDIIKIDIEGAEHEVFLKGDLEWLNNVNVIIIELHDSYKPGCTKAFFKAISNREYDAYFHHENIFIFFK